MEYRYYTELKTYVEGCQSHVDYHKQCLEIELALLQKAEEELVEAFRLQAYMKVKHNNWWKCLFLSLQKIESNKQSPNVVLSDYGFVASRYKVATSKVALCKAEVEMHKSGVAMHQSGIKYYESLIQQSQLDLMQSKAVNFILSLF